MRYGSAPGSLLTAAVDSVVGRGREFSRFFSSDPSESISKDGSNNGGGANNPREQQNKAAGLQRSYGFNEMATGGGSGGGGGGGVASSSRSTLIRHSSSPAGFLNQLATAAGDNGSSTFSFYFLFFNFHEVAKVYDAFVFSLFNFSLMTLK